MILVFFIVHYKKILFYVVPPPPADSIARDSATLCADSFQNQQKKIIYESCDFFFSEFLSPLSTMPFANSSHQHLICRLLIQTYHPLFGT